MDDLGHSTPAAGAGGAGAPRIKIANESWPPPDVARRLNDRPSGEQVAVEVRVAFETGDEWLQGTATRWHGQHVRVVTSDPRIVTYGLWVVAADVRRI